MDQNQEYKSAGSKPVQPVLPFRSTNSAVTGHDANFNLIDNKSTGQQSVGGSQVANVRVLNPKPTKQRKKQRKFGSNDASGSSKNVNQANPPVVDDDKAEDQMGVTDTYADYKPAKLKIGAPHPDAVVETSTLSSIEPNDITYELSIPKRVIEKGLLSALQLESIVYASQAHEKLLPDGTRAGFLIGDGAGVGKGRTVAGVIYENFQKGRKQAIWVSVSNDLKFDAERDLEDVGAPDISVWPLNKLKYGRIDSKMNGYKREGVIFSTYQSLISATGSRGINPKYNSRLKQLVEWCGPEFDGVIIFDECHKAKNLMQSGKSQPTKTGQTVLALQTQLPLARVVYASATGASEPRNMAYMVRLGLWGLGTSFRNFAEFLQTVEKRGVGAMEIVAMDMKLRGMYIARQLSFKGVTFNVEEVPLSEEFKQAYNDSVKLWVEARDKFEEASVLLGDNKMLNRSMWGQFWSAHQRFFKYLCIASKVSYAVEVAKKAVEDGKCVVIGLQSTGEARTLDVMERGDGELEDFVSTSKAVIEHLVEKQFPAPSRRFVDGKASKTAKKRKIESPSRVEGRSSGSMRKSTDSGVGRHLRKPAKKSRVIVISSDSDESDSEKKKMDVTDSDDDNDVVKAKKKSSGPDSDTDSSDSNSESDESSEKLSFIDNKARANNDSGDDGSESDGDSDSDIEMVRSARRRPHPSTPANKNGNKTMQDKVLEEVQKKLTGPNQSDAQANEALMIMCKRACDMRDELLDKIEELGGRLPSNTLDQLIEELGGPDEVAEMTGRKGRVVKSANGEVQYESRCQGESTLESVNMDEKECFMNGDKLMAIISEAASNGISLQSDRRVANTRRRVHITLELPWSADRAIQQFGRTHRSNQVNAPEYIFLISQLAGERRFASSVSKRLESLGALTHGDRRATETRNLSQFNVENKYGREALKTVCEQILNINFVSLSGDETEEEEAKHGKLVQLKQALKGVGIAGYKDLTIATFLNRILGLPVDLQNYMFDYFLEALDAAIEFAKRNNKYDMGIMDLGNTDNAEKVESLRFMREHATGFAPIDVTTVVLERGMTWEEAKKRSALITHKSEGFYRAKYARQTGNQSVCLALMVDPEGDTPIMDSKSLKRYNVEFQTHRPHTGTQVRPEKYEEVVKKGDKITPEQAQKLWNFHHNSSLRHCVHVFWDGRCKNKMVGLDCDIGMSRRRYTVLSGSIFAYWNQIERYVRVDSNTQIRMIRLKMTDGSKIVGVLLPNDSIEQVLKDLR